MTLSAQGLSVNLGERTILHGLDFVCRPGEITAIVGENGAGKSTLMNCLSGGLSFDGEVYLNSRSLKRISLSEQAKYRAVLPQHSTLNFPLDVREIVRLALSLGTLSDREQDTIICKSLAQVDAAQLINRSYLKLSGGEKQRVQIARVLAQLSAYKHNESQFLLLDEPTSALDLKHQYTVLKMIQSLCYSGRGSGVGALIILHDLNLASLYCDKVLLLKGGELIKHDTPRAVFSRDRVSDTFGIEVFVDAHPETKQPYLVPKV